MPSKENAAFIAAANPATILSLATLIEAQAAEIEGLRAALEPFVQHGRACGALADADNGPFWIMTDTGHRRDIPAEDFRRAFLASRTERAAIETTRAGSTLSVAERTNPHSR